MNYISTRGNKNLGNFFDVLLTGLAPDGGLSLPEKIPQLSLKNLENLKNLIALNYLVAKKLRH